MEFQEKKKMKTRNIVPFVFPKVTSMNFPVLPCGNLCTHTGVHINALTQRAFLKMLSKRQSLLYSILSSLLKHLLLFCPSCTSSRSQASLDTQVCLVSISPTLIVWERACPTSLGPHLGAHPGQGAKGLVGLFIRGCLKLLQPSQPTFLFEDSFGAGTYIAGPVP